MKPLHLLAAAALASGMLVVAMPTAQAETVTVTAGESIQTAIDFAEPGDVIKVGPGTFHEAVVVYKNDLTIIGHNTVIVPPAGKPGVCIVADPSCPTTGDGVDDTTVTGITVQKSTVDGFYVFGGEGTLLSNDHALNNGDAGFYLADAFRATVSQSVASGNKFIGFYVVETEGDTLTGDQAVNNGAGFGIALSYSTTLQNSIAKSNCAGLFVDVAGAIDVGPFVVANNVFSQNTKACSSAILDTPVAVKGVGALILSAQQLQFSNNAIQANGKGGKNSFSGGLVVDFTPGGANNVFSQNAFANNVPYDINADATGFFDNDFANNACHTSNPAGLC